MNEINLSFRKYHSHLTGFTSIQFIMSILIYIKDINEYVCMALVF